MKITFNELKQLIPHRYPFLLVDGILNYQENTFVEGLKNIACNDPYLNIDDNGIQTYPIGLMVESLGQLTAILYALSDKDKEKKEFILGSAKDIKVNFEVPANNQIILKARINHLADSYAIASGDVYCNQKLILSVGEFICKINPIII